MLANIIRTVKWVGKHPIKSIGIGTVGVVALIAAYSNISEHTLIIKEPKSIVTTYEKESLTLNTDSGFRID